MSRTLPILVLVLAALGCSPAMAQPTVPSTPLIDAHGATLDARQLAAGARFTVLVFFSPECHCLKLHDARLRDLYAAYSTRGVQIVMVDSEKRGTPDADAAEATRRGYPFPIVLDRGGKLADALGAQYATYTVIVDAQGQVLYRGGIDSDEMHLSEDTKAYVKDALDDLLAGRHPRLAEAKTLGCSLEKW
jgi:peroxiredoxin